MRGDDYVIREGREINHGRFLQAVPGKIVWGVAEGSELRLAKGKACNVVAGLLALDIACHAEQAPKTESNHPFPAFSLPSARYCIYYYVEGQWKFSATYEIQMDAIMHAEDLSREVNEGKGAFVVVERWGKIVLRVCPGGIRSPIESE